MSNPKIIKLRSNQPAPIYPETMIVSLTVGQLRELVAEVVEQKLRARLSNGKPNGLLTAEQAAEFLNYSTDWVYKNWQKIGGKKIGGKGLRFDAEDLQSWIKSRNGA